VSNAEFAFWYVLGACSGYCAVFLVLFVGVPVARKIRRRRRLPTLPMARIQAKRWLEGFGRPRKRWEREW